MKLSNRLSKYTFAGVLSALLFLTFAFITPRALADSGTSSTTITYTVPVGTSVSCSPGTTTASALTLASAGAVCTFTTNATTQITGTASSTVSLTGPTSGQSAVFTSATSTNATVVSTPATGVYTATLITSRPVNITFNYGWTPPANVMAGSYVGTVSISWTAT